MKSLKCLHGADFHLRDKDIEEARRCVDFLIDTAINEKVDLVVLAGDLFDSQDIKLDSLSAKLAAESLERLSRNNIPVLVSLGTESHEGTAPELFKYIAGVHVSTMPEQVFLQDRLIVDLEEVAKHGGADAVISVLPTPTKRFMQGSNDEVAAAMSGIFAGFGAQAAPHDMPHILVFHGSISGAMLSNNQTMTGRDIEISRDQIALSGAHLVACGHIHIRQQIGENIFYSGSLFPNSWGENHEHGFYIHELTNICISVSRFFETPHKRLVRIKEDWTNDQPQEPISLDGMDGAYVRYDITCWQDEAAGIDKEAIKKSFTEAGALDVDIRINRIPRENVRAEAVLKAESLRDKLVRQAELRGETVDEAILQKADELETVPMEELIEGATGAERKVAA